MPRKILVIGGAGYVGSSLVPKLLGEGHAVRVLDTFWFGKDVFKEYLEACESGGSDCVVDLSLVEDDIRYYDLNWAMRDIDTVIHLACIANDPSFDLDPELGRSVNYDAFLRVIRAAQEEKVRRFIFASSSSVYGVRNEKEVTEGLALRPITDYSKYKAFCEMELGMIPLDKLPWVTVRPATVCGWSPRLRLDLSVNKLIIPALTQGKITVLGGTQKRPNIHIDDMSDLYVKLVSEKDERILGRIFNAGGSNFSTMDLALIIKSVIREYKNSDIDVEVKPTDDLRSYHISSERLKSELGWQPRHTVSDAVRDIVSAFKAGKIPDYTDPRYYNIETIKLVSKRQASR